MNKICVIVGVLVVLFAALLMSAGGCVPKVPGLISGEPVDRATYEREAAQRRGQLEAEAARLAATLKMAKAAGDEKTIVDTEIAIAEHEVQRTTFNQLYGDGNAELNRQTEANEEIFTTLTAAGDLAAASFGIPPGISQLGIGAMLAFAGRAGWIRLKRPPQSPPAGRSDPPATPNPPVSA